MLKNLFKFVLAAVTLIICFMCLNALHAQTIAKVKVVKLATSHSVTLTCSFSPTQPPNVTGCNFYKGTTKGGETTTPLNTTPSLTFTDSSVVGLTTYYYTAESVCPTCSPSLSIPSNEITATIPGDPQPAAPTLSGVVQ